jgi:hypothetical protein
MSPGTVTTSTATTAQQSVPAMLRRRRVAASRCQPLDGLGVRDPWPSRNSSPAGDVAAWGAAEQYLAAQGLDVRWVRRDAMARGGA